MVARIACAKTKNNYYTDDIVVYFRRSEKYYCELLSTVSLVTTLTKVSLQHGADLGGCYFLKSLVQYRLLLLIWCIYRTQLE